MENFVEDYRRRTLSVRDIMKIHNKGFTVSDWCLLGLNKDNYKNYISNALYYSMHPINEEYSKWIDDKLTLKYLCYGTNLDRYMPKYYYQIDQYGKVLNLMDCPIREKNSTIEDILDLLKIQGVLAIKLISGSIGKGFYKAEYKDEQYYLNGRLVRTEEIKNTLESFKGYLITEYFHPHKSLAEYCPDTVNTIRYLVVKIDGHFHMFNGFVRFGTNKSGFVENYNAGGVLCYLNEKGQFRYGHIADLETYKDQIIYEHPDSKKKLENQIPMWKEITEACNQFLTHFPQMRYLGFDFVVTDKEEIKILEINSLSSLDTLQLENNIKGSIVEDFFEHILKER